MIFNSLGNLVNNEEYWLKKLDEIKKYIDENNKRPSSRNKNVKIKQMSAWTGTQISNYKNKTQIMMNESVYNKWTEFKTSDKYKTHFEIKTNTWDSNFEKVKKYIDENNKRPSSQDKNPEIHRLGRWLSVQIKIYSEETKFIDKLKYEKWNNFMKSDKYREYLINKEELWILKLEKVKKYIDINKKKPTIKNQNTETNSMGEWISQQYINFKDKDYISRNKNKYNKWIETIESEEYGEYLMNDEQKWNYLFDKVKEFIDLNNAKPTRTRTKPKETIKLGKWLQWQFEKYNEEGCNTKKPEFYNKWAEFITSDKYKKYFKK